MLLQYNASKIKFDEVFIEIVSYTRILYVLQLMKNLNVFTNKECILTDQNRDVFSQFVFKIVPDFYSNILDYIIQNSENININCL